MVQEETPIIPARDPSLMCVTVRTGSRDRTLWGKPAPPVPQSSPLSRQDAGPSVRQLVLAAWTGDRMKPGSGSGGVCGWVPCSGPLMHLRSYNWRCKRLDDSPLDSTRAPKGLPPPASRRVTRNLKIYGDISLGAKFPPRGFGMIRSPQSALSPSTSSHWDRLCQQILQSRSKAFRGDLQNRNQVPGSSCLGVQKTTLPYLQVSRQGTRWKC